MEMVTRTRTIEEIRQRLIDQRAEDAHRLTLLKAELLGATAAQNLEGTSTNHPADASSDALLAETDVSDMMDLERDIAEFDAALRRIEHGTFGQCVDCGDQIDPARLRVRPTAARCLHCQAKWEMRSSREMR